MILRSGNGPTPQLKSFHLLRAKNVEQGKNYQWNEIITTVSKVKKKNHHNFSCINRHFLDTRGVICLILHPEINELKM